MNAVILTNRAIRTIAAIFGDLAEKLKVTRIVRERRLKFLVQEASQNWKQFTQKVQKLVAKESGSN